MKTLSIKKSWFAESGNRLDASFHLSDGPSTVLKLKKSLIPLLFLSDAATSIFKGNIFKRTYVNSSEKGYDFITASDIMKSDITASKFISKRYSQINHLFVKKHWILISRSGTLGNTTFTNELFEGVVLTDDLIRIIPNNENILAGYLYAYLSSTYGYGLLTQSGYGGVVQHIEPHHIESLPIPVLPEEKQQKIHNLILDVSTLRVEANKLLEDAVDLFESEITKSQATLGFQCGSISSSSINNNLHKRLDGQFHLVWGQLEEEKSVEHQYIKLSVLATKIFVGGRGKRNYVENGISFLSSSDMMLFNPKRNSKKVGVNTKGLEEMKVDKNDILISRSGTVGNTVIIGNDLKGIAISEHALRLVIDPQKISPYYVFAYLRTNSGRRSMEASSFGSVIITLNEDLIRNIEIPILDESVQKAITDNIKGYVSHLDRATFLENEAIDHIEKEIDQWQQ